MLCFRTSINKYFQSESVTSRPLRTRASSRHRGTFRIRSRANSREVGSSMDMLEVLEMRLTASLDEVNDISKCVPPMISTVQMLFGKSHHPFMSRRSRAYVAEATNEYSADHLSGRHTPWVRRGGGEWRLSRPRSLFRVQECASPAAHLMRSRGATPT